MRRRGDGGLTSRRGPFQHPELIAAMVKASAQDFHTAMLVKVIEESAEGIGEALRHEKGDE